MQTTPPLRILVADDHEVVLNGTLSALRRSYSSADIYTAATAKEVINQLSDKLPNVLIVDLALPETLGKPSQAETGIRLLRHLIATYPELNIVVHSAHIRSLIRLKPTIDAHQGGFTMADKNLPIKEFLNKVEWAIQGGFYTLREMRNGLEFLPEWLEVLQLAFCKGLQDKTIAERMNVAERTVSYYWSRIRNVLEVYPEPGTNIRIQTEIRAREKGLID